MKIISSLSFAVIANQASACTYLSLEGEDQTVVASRTMEWGAFDNKPEIAFAPAGTEFKSMKLVRDALKIDSNRWAGRGLHWTSDYDIMGMTALNDETDSTLFADGVNSAGLTISFLYHPGTAEYPRLIPGEEDNTITALDIPSYVLSKCKCVHQARRLLKKVNIIGKYMDAIKGVVPAHFAIMDARGNEVVVEFLEGKMVIFEDTVNVMTNSPSYDWHLNNLRNYLYMSAHNWDPVELNGMNFTSTGYGSGLLGLPGDYTPPSRFVRAVALRQLARNTTGGEDTVREVLRIQQSFQLPYEGAPAEDWDVMKYGSTLWTCAYDLKNLKMYYRTSKFPSFRVVDMKAVNFENLSKGVTFLPLDTEEDVYATDRTPAF